MGTVNISGSEYPCRLTMGAMLRFKRLTGHDASGMSQGDIGDLVTLLYCCVASACNADGVDFPLELDTFADNIDPSQLEGLMDGFTVDGDAAAKKKARASKG